MESMITVKDSRYADIRFQDGGLPHAAGVKTWQVLRANRAHPEWADGYGWTYNHAPMLSWYHDRFYLEYLSNPVSEHEVPGHTLLTTSENGMDWSFPQVVFPSIEVPTRQYQGPKSPLLTDPIQTVPHQRMGFYRAQNDVMLVLSFYGIVHDRNVSAPCDSWGAGRAVRRIFPDGTLGDIHFLIYNAPAGYSKENLRIFPHYKDSADTDFIAACDELLSDGAVLHQMYEEQQRDASLFSGKPGKALSFYTVNDHEMIGVYKHGLSAVSKDDGKTWSETTRNPTIRTSTGKVWGQRTSDGRFALIYNPTTDGQHRWPIAIVTGDDGHTFDRMRSVTGYMGPQRYGGIDKNLGPQYMRGICERNPQSPDGHIWLTYSNNKEDIWISCIPVPVSESENTPVHDDFSDSKAIDLWNLYSPIWAPVRTENGSLVLKDTEPQDRASTERMLIPSAQGTIALMLEINKVSSKGAAVIELQDDAGRVPVLFSFREDGRLYVRSGGRTEPLCPYEYDRKYAVKITYDCDMNYFALDFDGKKSRHTFSASVRDIARLLIATKEMQQIPYSDINSNGKYGKKEDVLINSEEPIDPTILRIHSLHSA